MSVTLTANRLCAACAAERWHLLCNDCWRQQHGWKKARKPHLTWEECAQRWPNIVKCLQWTMIASVGEAACCIRDYRDGLPFGSECVSHSGLSPEDRVRRACSSLVREAVRLYGRK